MVKERFPSNPFESLDLSVSNANDLLGIVNTIVGASMQRYENFYSVEEAKVNPDKWKLVKTKENAHVFMEKQNKQQVDHNSPYSQSSSLVAELPSLLCVGTTSGSLEDIMLGVTNPTLEEMRIKTSYVEDLRGAAVLSNIVMPTEDAPFQSVVVKWMELDIPLQATGLIKNRDFVCVEATGTTETFDGEQVGFHLLHSVNFPQAHNLPNRVRANLSICAFFRQIRPNVVGMYVAGVIDPVGNERVTRLVVSNMANTFFSPLRYAHCGQMKKLSWSLERAYAKSKTIGAPHPERICVSCRKAVSRRVGDFNKSSSTCRLCFGNLCNTCKLQRKMSFIGADLRLTQRKVAFCAVCMHEALKTSAFDAAKTRLGSDARDRSGPTMVSKLSLYSDSSTVSSEGPSGVPSWVSSRASSRVSYGFVIF